MLNGIDEELPFIVFLNNENISIDNVYGGFESFKEVGHN